MKLWAKTKFGFRFAHEYYSDKVNNSLKVQCSVMKFSTFFLSKNSTWAPYEQAKMI